MPAPASSLPTSAQTDEEKAALYVRADEIFQTLIDAGVVERVEGGGGTAGAGDADDAGCTGSAGDAGGAVAYACTVDVPEDFALDQPLSPFLLAALELLDPEDETLCARRHLACGGHAGRPPRQVLRAQERAARDKAMAEMKADGVDYDERMERIAEVTYPRPLEDLLAPPAFERYCQEVPWARDFELSPKSVVRDMVGDGLGLQDLRAALQDRAVGGGRFCATWPTRTACSTRTVAARPPRRAAGGHRVVAGIPRALGGLEPGGRVGERGFGD